ncbi:MAG: hypothetical protein QNK31_06865, partial [Porticoccus sp.]|nr:hypothetical protein [Porticoccus sp.]
CEPSKVNKSKNVVVWASNDKGENWKPIISFQKDIWPMKLFQYGQVRFPAGDNLGPYLWLTPQGTNSDQISMRIRVI